MPQCTGRHKDRCLCKIWLQAWNFWLCCKQNRVSGTQDVARKRDFCRVILIVCMTSTESRHLKHICLEKNCVFFGCVDLWGIFLCFWEMWDFWVGGSCIFWIVSKQKEGKWVAWAAEGNNMYIICVSVLKQLRLQVSWELHFWVVGF